MTEQTPPPETPTPASEPTSENKALVPVEPPKAEKPGFGKRVSDFVINAINDADEVAAKERVDALRAKYPEADESTLSDMLIRKKAQQAAAVGAVTSSTSMIPGLGTLVSLTFGVAADIGVTFKLQAELVLEMAALYDHELDEAEKQRVVLAVTGISAGANQLLNKAGQEVAAKATERLTHRAVSRSIPVIGVAASAGTNFLSTHIIGQRARAYFSLGPDEMGDWKSSIRALSGVDDTTTWLMESTDNAWNIFKDSSAKAGEAVIESGKSAGELVVVGVDKSKLLAQQTGRSVVSGITVAAGAVSSATGKVGGAVGDTAGKVGGAVSGTAGKVGEGVGKAIDKVGDTGRGVMGGVGSVLDKVSDTSRGVVGGVVGGVSGGVSKVTGVFRRGKKDVPDEQADTDEVSPPEPPLAEIIPHETTVHGQTRIDNYFWLREKDNPATIDYLKAENAYTEAMMAHTQALQDSLYEEMVGRIQETDSDVPEKIGEYFYYSRTETGQEYRIYCRKQGSLEAEEEILLDQNELAEGEDFCLLGVFEVSPDHRWLAYGVDTTGSERFTLFVKNLETGELLSEQIDNVDYSFAWASDNQTFFYVRPDAARRPFQLYRHRLHSDPAEDVLVYEEADEAYFLGVRLSRSEQILFLELGSAITDEVHFLAADTPLGEFQVIEPRQVGREYRVAHHGDSFYIVTNDEAINFKLMQASIEAPGLENWTTLIPHRETVKLDDVEAFRDHLVLEEREQGLSVLRVMDLPGGEIHRIEFEEPVYTVRPGGNPDFNTQVLRFNYTSLITPSSVFDYDMVSRERTLKKRKPVLGGYDPSQYRSERIFAEAEDGTQVPISLVYKVGLERDGSAPCHLLGYGSYGASTEPYFSSNRLSLLNRGFVCALAHVRGGGEMGRPWYEGGKFLHKRNTFSDFIACAEHLVAENYTQPDRLIAEGRSAGGLLMGAIANLRPDLFHAVLAIVPFVDVVNTMLDPSIPLTVIEYDEWGNPTDKTYFDYMLSYSPYDNVQAQAYPHLLVTAGLNDPRVHYWEPAKWVAKLRKTKTDENRLLLKTEMGAGHGGPTGRYQYLREVAFNYAFVLDVV